jgi:hypothetical protein
MADENRQGLTETAPMMAAVGKRTPAGLPVAGTAQGPRVV